MPSTYSPTLRIQLIADGEQSGTWGDTTNDNLGTLIEQAITGRLALSMPDANVTLTANNGTPDQSRNAIIEFTGVLTASRNIIVPTVTKLYTVKNATTGGFALVIKTTAGNGITVPAGVTELVYCNGTDVVDGVNNLASGSKVGNVPIVSTTDVQTLTNKTLTAPVANYTVYPEQAVKPAASANSGYNYTQDVSGTTELFYENQAGVETQITSGGNIRSFPSGTSMMFVQTTAPTGWTKSTTHNNKALRVVSGTASSGGTIAFTTAFASQAVSGSNSAYALTQADIPVHNHAMFTAQIVSSSLVGVGQPVSAQGTTGGGPGDYVMSAGTITPTLGVTGNIGGGLGHTHTFTGTAINLAVQYVDVIIATKD